VELGVKDAAFHHQLVDNIVHLVQTHVHGRRHPLLVEQVLADGRVTADLPPARRYLRGLLELRQITQIEIGRETPECNALRPVHALQRRHTAAPAKAAEVHVGKQKLAAGRVTRQVGPSTEVLAARPDIRTRPADTGTDLAPVAVNGIQQLTAGNVCERFPQHLIQRARMVPGAGTALRNRLQGTAQHRQQLQAVPVNDVVQ
jgi:hypothetical protein